ncbi:uncharacterized [Tachysurus ichikawai]
MGTSSGLTGMDIVSDTAAQATSNNRPYIQSSLRTTKQPLLWHPGLCKACSSSETMHESLEDPHWVIDSRLLLLLSAPVA